MLPDSPTPVATLLPSQQLECAVGFDSSARQQIRNYAWDSLCAVLYLLWGIIGLVMWGSIGLISFIMPNIGLSISPSPFALIWGIVYGIAFVLWFMIFYWGFRRIKKATSSEKPISQAASSSAEGDNLSWSMKTTIAKRVDLVADIVFLLAVVYSFFQCFVCLNAVPIVYLFFLYPVYILIKQVTYKVLGWPPVLEWKILGVIFYLILVLWLVCVLFCVIESSIIKKEVHDIFYPSGSACVATTPVADSLQTALANVQSTKDNSRDDNAFVAKFDVMFGSVGKSPLSTQVSSGQQEARVGVSTEQPQNLPPTKKNANAPPKKKSLDPVTLYSNSRDAVATILVEDDLGFDVGQGSGFFLPRELVGTCYLYHKLTEPSVSGDVCYAYLLTNYHVIRSAAEAKVQLNNGHSGRITDVVMEQEDVDLAVVLVNFSEQSNNKPDAGIPISTLDIANGPELPVGTKVYAIGSPKGWEASLSEGIISGKRKIAEGNWWLQTTAPISPGSSGGPLLNSSGEVIGLIKGYVDGQNLNFAVPASQIRAFLIRQFNSRPLWRGTGIEEEEWNAYIMSSDPGQVRSLNRDFRLMDADKQIDNGKYDDALRGLANIVPSEFSKYEYLLLYTIGRATRYRGEEQLNLWLDQSKEC